MAAMARLVRAGWSKLVTTKTEGRPIHRWQVNPLLFSGAPTPERSERSERVCSGIDALIGQLEAAGMTQHLRVI
jgi:hypothetical protein